MKKALYATFDPAPDNQERDVIIQADGRFQIIRTRGEVRVCVLPGIINPKLTAIDVSDVLGISRPVARRMISEGQIAPDPDTERAETDLTAILHYLSEKGKTQK